MIPFTIYVAILGFSAMFLFAIAAWAAWKDREHSGPVEDPFDDAWAVATSIFQEPEENEGSTATLIL
jgi:hypothetical protein